MFSNTVSVDSPADHSEKNNLRNIYHKFQSLLGRGAESPTDRHKEEMLSSRSSTTASEDSFITPVSSVGDLMALSPKRTIEDEHPDVTSDLLTGTEFDSICDVTMKEVPMYDDYIDASSLDYLVKCAESNRNHNHVDRGKESLFVKFDPLYARQEIPTRAESIADSIEYDIGYETGSAASVDHVASPKNTMSAGSVVTSCKDKPTQVVPPVVNDVTKPATYTRSTPALLRSVSAILTPTQVATDRLISFSGNTPPTAAPRSPRCNQNHSYTAQSDRLQHLRHILQRQDKEIFQLAQENRELRSSLQEIENKYTQTINELQAKVTKFTDEKDNLLERENKLLQQVNDKIMSNKQMSIVMEEYEKTISSLICEQQQDRIQFQEIQESLTSEKDQALTHLSSMESSFNDLLAKYEKCKSVIMETRDREKIYEQKISEYEVGIKKYEKLYNELKRITSESLSKANETLESTKKNYGVEIMKLNATIKKHEISIASLQESLVQKTRDNEELTRICDQLINDVR